MGDMKVDPAEIEMVLKLLAATPRDLESVSKGLDHRRLHRRTDDEPWTANDFLAHLRACANVWGKSIMAMIAQDHPTLRYVSPRIWIKRSVPPSQAISWAQAGSVKAALSHPTEPGNAHRSLAG